MFGILKHRCTVKNMNSNEVIVEILKPGTLIQIIPNYSEDRCYFKISDSLNQSSIYSCLNDDYVPVTKELWQYLISLHNYENQINFVNSVCNRKFDLDMLKLGRNIKIRAPHSMPVNYYDFVVKYNGEMEEIGPGYYIGLQFKNNIVPLNGEINSLSRYYRFVGKGIIVTAYWIMENMYKEQFNTSQTSFHKLSISKHNDNRNELDEVPVRKTILDNQKTKCIDSNQRLCPNQACDNVLPNTRKIHTNNERCTKCKLNWCYICLSIHEPGERHGNKQDKTRANDAVKSKSIKQILQESTNSIDKTVDRLSAPHKSNNEKKISEKKGAIPKIRPSNIEFKSTTKTDITKCNLCVKRLESNCEVILSKCQHSFCKRCIRNYIEQKIKCPVIRCPYNKDYACPFEISEAEIKNVTGDLVSNKFRENQLKTNGATVHNTRVKPNLDSRESCVKISNPILGSCSKCKKSNIPTRECIKLQNCDHTFCNNCIAMMIKTQTSGSLYAKCTICSKTIEDNEVSRITGPSVLKLFLDNRNKQPDIDSRNELCICNPRALDCDVVLKCTHRFCRTFLTTLIQKQYDCISCPVCPICSVEIDSYLIKRVIGQINSDNNDKCQTCSKSADIQLAVCKHSFCHKCIYDIILDETLNFKKMSIDCSICKISITESDISQYGSNEILELFKKKIKGNTEESRPVNHITLNDDPFACVLCERQISVNHGVVLARCQHTFCIACTKEFVSRQLSSSQNPTCPICQKMLEQFEVKDMIGQFPDSSKVNTISIECLKCERNIEEKFAETCKKCGGSLCLNCAKSTMLTQIENNLPHNCLFCGTFLNECQFDGIESNSIQPVRKTIYEELNRSYTVEMLFECIMCEKSAERDSQIVLANCHHEICLKCLQQTFTEQVMWSQTPKCPICLTEFDKIQLNGLQISTATENLSNRILTREPSTEETDNCSVCYEKFKQKISLKECGHEFCWQCVNASVSMQQSNGNEPRCPMCRKSIEPDQITNYKFTPEIKENYDATRPLQLNNNQCIICERNVNPESWIVLANCGDSFCRDCIILTMLQQSANRIEACCVICQTRISNEEVRLLAPAVHDIFEETSSNSIYVGNRESIKTTTLCSLCSRNMRQTTSLNDCGHYFCEECIQTSVLLQCDRTRCPMCYEPNPIIVHNTFSPVLNRKVVSEANASQTTLQLNKHPFKCIICNQNIQIECGINLSKCGDSFCRDCISNVILQQAANNVIPKCPLCDVVIKDDEIYLLNPVGYDIMIENRQR